MSRNRRLDSSRRAAPASDRKIDVPVLVVATLTAFFGILFTTLLLLHSGASHLGAPPSTAVVSAAPPVSAPTPRKPVLRDEPEPILNPTLRSQLEQLGIKCAEGAHCDSD
jgi:hypothetical protein